jgi:hypothetical protein
MVLKIVNLTETVVIAAYPHHGVDIGTPNSRRWQYLYYLPDENVVLSHKMTVLLMATSWDDWHNYNPSLPRWRTNQYLETKV